MNLYNVADRETESIPLLNVLWPCGKRNKFRSTKRSTKKSEKRLWEATIGQLLFYKISFNVEPEL